MADSEYLIYDQATVRRDSILAISKDVILTSGGIPSWRVIAHTVGGPVTIYSHFVDDGTQDDAYSDAVAKWVGPPEEPRVQVDP